VSIQGIFILCIETSCDDTCIALYDSAFGIRMNIVCTQESIHNFYGGIVPKVAQQQHILALESVITYVLYTLKVYLQCIFSISYTNGPGLYNSLLTGFRIAKKLSCILRIPCYAINHIEGHIYSTYIGRECFIHYPFSALVISGGHTLFVMMLRYKKCILIGRTLDDSVGESFDKVARLLGFCYPGGPCIELVASFGSDTMCSFYKLLPLQHSFNLSFSGTKTAIRSIVWSVLLTTANIVDVAISFQESILNTLHKVCLRLITYSDVRVITVTGGVSSNRELYKKLTRITTAYVLYPCGTCSSDNAGMLVFIPYIAFYGKCYY
jgi:N6-L-threonylcarbamoyladenine synthase